MAAGVVAGEAGCSCGPRTADMMSENDCYHDGVGVDPIGRDGLFPKSLSLDSSAARSNSI